MQPIRILLNLRRMGGGTRATRRSPPSALHVPDIYDHHMPDIRPNSVLRHETCLIPLHATNMHPEPSTTSLRALHSARARANAPLCYNTSMRKTTQLHVCHCFRQHFLRHRCQLSPPPPQHTHTHTHRPQPAGAIQRARPRRQRPRGRPRRHRPRPSLPRAPPPRPSCQQRTAIRAVDSRARRDVLCSVTLRGFVMIIPRTWGNGSRRVRR